MANVTPFYGTSGPYGGLSNFYRADFEFKGQRFHWSEQAIMWQKAMLFDDYKMAEAIMQVTEPKQAKKYGRYVTPYIDATWVTNRENLVVPVLRAKFEQNADLKEMLLGTGNSILVEASPRDQIWGVGMSITNPLIFRPECWQGTNLQGQFLMKVREILRT